MDIMYDNKNTPLKPEDYIMYVTHHNGDKYYAVKNHKTGEVSTFELKEDAIVYFRKECEKAMRLHYKAIADWQHQMYVEESMIGNE